MKKYLVGFFYSMPVQLLLMHFRRYQVLLFFWYILFATISGNFLEAYGANSLYLAPEYLGKVNALSTGIVGFAIAVFIMSWNITTFILHTKHIRFLATTTQPFLKFCINNAVLPVIFLGCYLFFAVRYQIKQELMGPLQIFLLFVGFIAGFALSIFIAFIYFFRTDKTIYRRMATDINSANKKYERNVKRRPLQNGKNEMRVDWFLSATFKLRKPRNIKHYSEEFLEGIFKRHHFAALFAIFVAFICLMGVGIFSDNNVFQVPAAASISVFFAILIAVAGSFTLFLHSWSIPFAIVLYIVFNWMYQTNIIDPRNKAYGLNYLDEKQWPSYERDSLIQLASDSNMELDKNEYLKILNEWKQKQKTDKPVLFVIDVSGGGLRSATFTMNVLQRLDSITNGQLMKHTILINGASGGMIGAAYFRELYHEKISGSNIHLQDKQYVDNISGDLLNPIFSTFVARDIIGPIQKFKINGYKYSKDRGFAFEQKLNANTKGVLDKKIDYYKTAEENGEIPAMFFNSVISRDGRKMIMGTHPLRFLMEPVKDNRPTIADEPDAIDFNSFFQKRDVTNLRLLSALRMNATFPYVLPNVWLPAKPVIDVMDAGLRDNSGMETSLRFINVFQQWLKENTGRVVLIQIRDRSLADWERPLESNSVLSLVSKPLLLLQNNWNKMQDYYQEDELKYISNTFDSLFDRIIFQYVPSNINTSASLSFHLTAAEKVDIAEALNNSNNVRSFRELVQLMK